MPSSLNLCVPPLMYALEQTHFGVPLTIPSCMASLDGAPSAQTSTRPMCFTSLPSILIVQSPVDESNTASVTGEFSSSSAPALQQYDVHACNYYINCTDVTDVVIPLGCPRNYFVKDHSFAHHCTWNLSEQFVSVSYKTQPTWADQATIVYLYSGVYVHIHSSSTVHGCTYTYIHTSWCAHGMQACFSIYIYTQDIGVL